MMKLLLVLRNQLFQFVTGDAQPHTLDDPEIWRIIIGFIICFNIICILFANNFIIDGVNIIHLLSYYLKQKGVNPRTETKICIKFCFVILFGFIIVPVFLKTEWHYYIFFSNLLFANIFFILALGK
eukprot:UN11043